MTMRQARVTWGSAIMIRLTHWMSERGGGGGRPGGIINLILLLTFDRTAVTMITMQHFIVMYCELA